ncbi:MAG: relaxase domain-containing protein [Planctomycetes bacterium]|nr:relaxase domain-containing protein [Planctomycetota bacterium]
MLSVKAIGNVGYYLELAREDYYLEGGEPPGRWWGSGAERLGVRGHVERDHLEKLALGFSLDDTPLVQNAGRDNRQVGWDLTFSAPKSVSVVWSHADPELRRSVQEAHDRAVAAALAYLESELAFTRRGKSGAETEHVAGLVAATFQHGTSRALDPQLHTHTLVLNVATRTDGPPGTVLSKPFYDHKLTLGAVYRVQLSYELQRLGLECHRDKTSFAVTGVSKVVSDHFSTRRKAIEKELQARGLETASAAAMATLATREVKDVVPPRKELFRLWQDAGRALGFTTDTVRHLLGTPSASIKKRHYEEALSEAVKEITASQSHFSESELLRHVACASQGRGLDAKQVWRGLKDTLAKNPDFVRLGERNQEVRYTTKAMLALEKELLQAVERFKQDDRHLARAKTVNAVIEHYSKPRGSKLEEAKHHARGLMRAARGEKTTRLDRGTLRQESEKTLADEQISAIRHLPGTPGNIKVLSGYAGTGKTFLLNACREIWERDGYTVIGACLSSRAAHELGAKTGIQCDTLKMLQLRMEPDLAHRLKHHGRQLLRAALHKPTYRQEPLKLDAKTVLLIDEAGMIGTKQMKWLIDVARKAGCKLVLTGEGEQLQPIEAGGPYPAIARIVGQAELTDIRRQKNEQDRKLVLDVRAGRAREALQDLARRGLLFVEKNRSAAIDKLVSDWARVEGKNPKDCLLFCGTNDERRELNRRCQALRVRAAHIDASNRIKLEDVYIYKGDRVILRQNARQLGVSNGDKGTVLAMNRLLGTLTVQLDDRRRVVIPYRSYTIRFGEHQGELAVQLGYAVTTHAGQGATVKRAYLVAGGSMQDREMSYVQVSRHVQEVRLYTDQYEAGPDLKNLARQMEKSRKKDLAHDVQREERERRALVPELTIAR